MCVCVPEGCASAQGGCLPRGSDQWGLTSGVCPGGGGRMSARGGVCQTLPVDRMTDACENITFPQLLFGR